jgi:hypothetical protein
VVARHAIGLLPGCPEETLAVNPDVWVVSSTEDMTSHYFTDFARARGFSCNHIDLDGPRGPLWLQWESERGLNIEIAAGIYFRPPGFVDPALATAVNILWGTLSLLSIPMVNRYAPQSTNSSKPLQTASLVSGGMYPAVSRVPTRICMADRLGEFRPPENFVVKSISGERSQVVALADPRLQRSPNASSFPVQIQSRLRGLNVRAHVCGDAVVAAKITGDAVDYRYSPKVGIYPYTLPADVQAWCVAAATSEGLDLAGIDLIVTEEGKWFCFEINPMPGYHWFENALIEQGEAPAVSELLLRRLVNSKNQKCGVETSLAKTESAPFRAA